MYFRRKLMPKKIISMLLISTAFLQSCATTKRSIILGLASGAGAGAVIGAASSNDHDKGAVTGLAIGAVVGAIAAYFIDDGLQKRDQDTRKDTLFNLEKHGVFGGSPQENYSPQGNFPYGLTAPVVDEQYIDTHVEENTKLIEGHRIWTIQDGAQWNLQTPKRKSK
jgi:hypothetical protein